MSKLREHEDLPRYDPWTIARIAGATAASSAAVTVGGVVGVSSLACRCGQDRFDYESWAETDGAAGRINMAAVQEALEAASDPSDFEMRVNQVYEGYHPILVRVYNVGEQQRVEGWEDLDDSATIDQGTDDKLFTLTRGPQGTRLEGHGANSYYTHAYPPGYSPAGGFFTGFLVGSLLARGPYVTPPARVSTLRSRVSAYRNSSAFQQQRARNSRFYARQRASNPRFGQASRSVSPARQSFRNSVRSSGGFRSSLGRSGGRFRGGGR